jgi:hypothetical protein
MSTTVETVDIRPFQVDVPDEALEDLRRRIAATHWPEKETVADQSQGVPLAMIQKLARYWMTDYDWRTCQANLKRGRQGRALRRLGGAGALLRRGAIRLQVTSLERTST